MPCVGFSYKLDGFVKQKGNNNNIQNIPDSNNSTDERKRSKSIGFSVRFADGHIVSESNGIKTMIETLRYIGLERVSKYRKVFSGYYLVDKQQREDNRHTWQHYVDGWWIYANLSNGKKITVLKEIAKMFEISLEIFIDKQPNTSPDSLSTSINQKKRTKYSLNGGIACYKNQSVLNAIHLFMDEMPNATYADILEFFPKELQGSYGVIQTLSQIEERKAKGFQTENRFFLGNNEILTSGDGIRFAVSSEWGPINFPIFQKHILENFGWTLNEVE